MLTRKDTFPCTKGCPKRTIYCHSTCEEYKEAKEKYNKKMDELKQIKNDEEDIVGYVVKSVHKTKKRCGMI